VKRITSLLALFAMLITACGLKVPATIVAGDSQVLDDTVVIDPNTGAVVDTDPGDLDPGDLGDVGDVGDVGDTDDGVIDTAGSIFKSETEGITKDRITVCAHVPITGAAPIPHHENRFGQFYFDYVNQELGGVYGRQVTFRAIDDQYYPAGARKAMTECASQGAFIYFGAAGTDQIVSVAKWAEEKQVPYLHGPTSVKDIGGLHYNVHAGPTYEYQHQLLARYLVKRFGKDVTYGTVRVDSPFFQAGVEAFKAELAKLGATHAVEIKVQKDEKQFQNVFFDLAGVDVVNNFTTPNIWINMMAQKPATYNPWWTAVSPVAGFNIVAAALPDSTKAVVFQHFQPACECQTYRKAAPPPKALPWYDDIQEFLRIFRTYSPEQDPDPDDFDYSSYLSSKGIHRLLLQAGPEPTRTKLWALFDSYKEKATKTFPGCPGDFSRSDDRIGAWSVNIMELRNKTWTQNFGDGRLANLCVDRI